MGETGVSTYRLRVCWLRNIRAGYPIGSELIAHCPNGYSEHLRSASPVAIRLPKGRQDQLALDVRDMHSYQVFSSLMCSIEIIHFLFFRSPQSSPNSNAEPE